VNGTLNPLASIVGTRASFCNADAVPMHQSLGCREKPGAPVRLGSIPGVAAAVTSAAGLGRFRQ